MISFKNILVFYNNGFSDILPEVMKLMNHNQANLKIIDVFDDLDQYIGLMPPSSSIDELKKIIVSERREEIMGHLKSMVKPDGDGIDIVIKFGNPAIEVIKEVMTFGHDIVIKAASGPQSFKDRLFGGVAVRLLRKCPCPVFILKPSPAISFKNILVPIDPDINVDSPLVTEESEEPISRKIMDLSLYMAQMEESTLHILHCWFLPGETLLSSARSRIAPEELNRMAVLAEKIHLQKMNTLLSPYDLSKTSHSLIIEKGDPGKKIIEYANKNQIDLIIMGTVGRSGLSGLFIGNTAERVIEEVNCSVLTVKPSQFSSPVKQ